MIKIYKMKNNVNAGYLRELNIHAINNGFIIKILPNNNGLFSKRIQKENSKNVEFEIVLYVRIDSKIYYETKYIDKLCFDEINKLKNDNFIEEATIDEYLLL